MIIKRLINFQILLVLFYFGTAPVLFCQVEAQTRVDSIYNSTELTKDKKSDALDNLLSYYSIENDTLAAAFFKKQAKRLYKLNAPSLAINYLTISYDIEKAVVPQDSMTLQKTSNLLSYYHYKNKQYRKSIALSRQSILLGANTSIALRNYSRIASSFLKLNNYTEALKAFEDVIVECKNKEEQLNRLKISYLNASIACREISSNQSLKKNLRFLNAADSLAKITKTNSTFYYQLYLAYGGHYNLYNTLDIPRAELYYNKALAIAQKEGNDSRIGTAYFILGNLHNTTNPDLAIQNFTKSLEFTSASDSLRLYQIYTNLGFTLALKQDYEQAKTNFYKGLNYILDSDFNDVKTLKNELLQSDYKVNLIKVLPALAETYLVDFKNNGNKESLIKSIELFKTCDYLVDILKFNSRSYRSKLFWSKLKTDVYGKAIHASFLANNIDDAFYFMEKNKALLLQEDIATRDFKASLDIPSDVLERELDLKTKVFQLNQNIIAHDNNQDSLRNILTKAKTELAVLQDSLNIKTQDIKIPELLSIVDVQQNMSQDDLILEYHISIDDGFGIYSNNDKANMLLITKDTVKFYEISNQQKLKNDVNQLLVSIKKPFETQQDIQDYKTLSYGVYTTLFPDEFARQLIKNKSLNIIPDSYLNFLPFAALVINNTDEIKYLIEQTDVRYNYSMSFLNQLDKEFVNDNEVLGIAPVEFSYDDLNTLENSKTEIEAMLDSFNGEELIGLTATKENFLNDIPNHNIIHLATHADAQDSISPWIALVDGKLYLEELYNTSNTAKLVVLSGCNTTLGTEEIGEGVMSLARGFFYSGTQSVISTLWSIDDNSTTTIVTDFYKSLEQGTTKSQALREAKLNYLNSHNRSEASPYYWASFVIIGSNEPIPASQSYWVWFAIALGICLLFLTAYLLKYRTR